MLIANIIIYYHKLKNLLLLYFPIFILSSCESSTERIMARILIPIAFFSVLSLVLKPIIERNKKQRRQKIENEINSISRTDEQDDFHELKNENIPFKSGDQSFQYEFSVKTELPWFYQLGCLVIFIGLLISWFGFWFDSAVFKLILIVLIVFALFWLLMYELFKKQKLIKIEIKQNQINFFDDLGVKLFEFQPKEFKKLKLLETTVESKGLVLKTDSWMQLWIEENEIENSNLDKITKFKEIVCSHRISGEKKSKYPSNYLTKEDLALEWMIKSDFETMKLRNEMLRFCQENSIKIVNNIGV
jgi:hypothetical protein